MGEQGSCAGAAHAPRQRAAGPSGHFTGYDGSEYLLVLYMFSKNDVSWPPSSYALKFGKKIIKCIKKI